MRAKQDPSLPSVRLNKFLAEAGVCSRRKADCLITEGRITVNGIRITQLGFKLDPLSDRIKLDGKLIDQCEEKHLFLFNKPPGVVSTLSDPQDRPCLADYLKRIPFRLYPVGRLDFDACGLMILTNEGQLAQQMLHPRYALPRVYLVMLAGRFDIATCQKMINGIYLSGQIIKPQALRKVAKRTNLLKLFGRSSKVSDEEETSLAEITIHVGSKHVVKRLFAEVGFPVIGLCRTAFGKYRLGDIPRGKLVQVY